MSWLIRGVFLVGLAGCSLSPFVTSQTVDYNGAIEAANNQLLLANILRARDHAPLYFSDLSQISRLAVARSVDQSADSFRTGERCREAVR